MKPSTLAYSAAASALLLLASPSKVAQACSPAPPGLNRSMPADGETYPANAAVVFWGSGNSGGHLSLAKVRVTVDGQAATLAAREDFSYARVADITPQPQAGQEVLIEGNFCEGDEAQCPLESIRYTATAPDLKPPASPSGASLTFYDYADFEPGVGGCQQDSAFAYWLHWSQTEVEAAGDAPLHTLIELEAPGAPGVPVWRRDLLGGPSSATLRDVGSTAGNNCYRIRLLDLAGNEAAESALVCTPTYCRSDAASAETTTSPPSEPTWTDVDICDAPPFNPDDNWEEDYPLDQDMADEDDGSGRFNSSYGCRIDAAMPSNQAPWMVAGLLGLLGTRRRRRR